MSERSLRQSRRSLTPCRPSVRLYCPGKDSWDLPMSGLGTITAKIQTEETEAQRRSGECGGWKEAPAAPTLCTLSPLSAFSTAPTYPLGRCRGQGPSLTGPQCPSIHTMKLRLDACQHPSSSGSPSCLPIRNPTPQRGCSDSCRPTHCPCLKQGLWLHRIFQAARR